MPATSKLQIEAMKAGVQGGMHRVEHTRARAPHRHRPRNLTHAAGALAAPAAPGGVGAAMHMELAGLLGKKTPSGTGFVAPARHHEPVGRSAVAYTHQNGWYCRT